MEAQTDVQRRENVSRVWLGFFTLTIPAVALYLVGAFAPIGQAWAQSFYFGASGGLLTSAFVILVEKRIIER